MASKLNDWSRDVYRSALLGVLLYCSLTTCFHGFHKNLEEKTHANRDNISAQGQGLVGRSISDGFRAVAIQFLHFLVAKSLQFRYIPVVLQQQPVPFMSMTFWLAFTRSISHQVL